jgi:hypothetical protein
LAVGLLQPLHEFRQRVFGALNQQVDVIGHQTIGDNSASRSIYA